jgi:tRNA(Ile)-lysidine synthase
MLTVSRQEVLAYLAAHDLPHREDATNGEDDCLRNRLRHHVMPLLK